MDGLSGWILAGLALLAGLLLGVLAHAWWMMRLSRAKRRIPSHWPLTQRQIANSEERRVWRWLSRAFFDHHVMIKLPVTRFTLPRDKGEGAEWYELLSGAYCTFTIVDSEGRVLGCVDVPGNVGLSKSTRMLKQSLLDQCGIGYWVVTSSSLPSLTDIRVEFLGDEAAAVEPRSPKAADPQIASAKDTLRAAIDKQRSSRVVSFDPMSSDPDQMPNNSPGEEFDPEGEPNSFLVPLDSRRGELR